MRWFAAQASSTSGRRTREMDRVAVEQLIPSAGSDLATALRILLASRSVGWKAMQNAARKVAGD